MQQWRERPLEVLQKLREEDPLLPSAKVGTDINRSMATAEARSTEPMHLVRLLRGDLDWITMKALEKDRMRRYGSPSDLAADIQRHLQHQPVLARPPSASYRASKFIRRHRFGVGTAVAAVALLIAFATAMGLQALRIAEERDRANRIADFMTQMFRVSDPSEARGNSVTARAILDKASNDIKAGLARDPEMQSELMFTMARTYANLGLYSVAHGLSATALESRRRLLGPEDSKTLESMTQLGWILDREGRDDEAEKLTRQAVDQGRRVLGSEHTVTLEAMENLAGILERQAHFEEEIELRVLGPEHPQTLRTMHDLANRIQEQGRYAEAEGLYRETLAIEQHVLGREHPDSASTMVALANTLYYEGHAAEAEKLYRESLEIEQRALGLEHPYTTRAQEGLANVLADEGHFAEAEKLRRQVLEIRQHTLGPEHTDTLLSKYNMADLLRSEGHFVEAERMIREVLAAQARVLGPENPDTLASKATLARILIKEGRYPEAENMARHVLETQLRVLGPQHLDTLNTLQFLGVALVYNRHYGEAKNLFSDMIEKISKTQGTETNVSLAWYSFACVAAAAHDPDEAVHHLREAVNHGYKNIDQIRADDDLKSLRGRRNFEAFLAYAQKRADAQRQHN
jgi:non-specific serine/threonine protein kinase/serine/threonine-protein kinase